MKSSVRILAIALALAFLLLARTAFQDSPTSAKEHIDLKDGEASFADPINGLNEASYLGFGDAATKTVYFYIKSEDLGTKVTARTSSVDLSAASSTLTSSDLVYTLRGGNTEPASVSEIGTTSPVALGDLDAAAATTTVALGLDTVYCDTAAAIEDFVVTYDGGATFTKADDAETMIKVSGWGVATTTDGALADGACASASTRGETARTAISESKRNELATAALAALKQLNMDEEEAAKDANALLYSYKSGNDYVAATSTNPKRRYTNQMLADSSASPATRDTIGGDDKPLAAGGVKITVVDTDTSGDEPVVTRTSPPTFDDNRAGGVFRIAYALGDAPTTGSREHVVDATFDIVDVYQASDTTASDADYPAYTSGYARAYVSSGSDSGQWVTIMEVADETDNSTSSAKASATTNLFQGWVVITNDTDHEGPDTIYAQDGDTLTLQVFDENGNRSSDVLATATALIDNSPPTISNLIPADEAVINDDALRVSFTVNDEGAGSDFRNIENVVKMVQVQSRTTSGAEPRADKGTECELASGSELIDNAGGNASSVGVLVAPSGQKFTKCPAVVKTTDGGKFNLIITVQDLAGNEKAYTSQLTIDRANPTVKGNPSVGQAWDEDKNRARNSANSILIEFSESLNVDTVAASDFTVAGYTIDTVEVVGTNDDAEDDPKMENQNLNKYVVLTLTEDLANNARPSVTVTGVNDVAGNTIQKVTRTSDNKIAAKLTVVPFSALIAKDGEQAISFTADEALRSMGGDYKTEASVNGDLKGLAIKVAADTMGGSGTFKQSTFDESGVYGVMLRAVDINGNKTDEGEVKVSDEPYELTEEVTTGAKFDVMLDNWPLADTGFDNDVKGEVKAYIGKTMVASSTGVVDWKDGAVELQASAGRKFAKGDTINLTYSHVHADQVIQVDVDEPTMESNPKDNSETDYAAGAIQFTWSEGKEYAGDKYDTVTLNSAMHEGSGTSTDILSKLRTNDNKTWTFRPDAPLALGEHEFTLKATDPAGNSATVSVTITVIERKPVEIDLSPGWNLISLRGMPASADVNAIFATSSGVTVVSQYDGRRVSPWTVWNRRDDGSLSSSPAGRMSIDSGLGMYVLSDGTPLEVDIPGVSRDAPAQVPPSIDLIPGWNLVAVILIGNRTEVGVNEYLPQGAWTRAFRLNNTTGQFDSFSPATANEQGEFENDPMLNSGDALWVYATEAAVIVPR